MRLIAKFVFWAKGWKLDKSIPGNPPKAVVVHAPHTSNTDFILGYLAFRIFRRRIRFLVKSEAFKGLRGWFVKFMGGLPVDRSKKNKIVDQVVEIINTHDDMLIMFTPEGTRKRTDSFKSGFYHVAQNANVPIILCYMDYTKKRGGFLALPELTGNPEIDIPRIREQYYGIDAKVVEQGVFPPQEQAD